MAETTPLQDPTNQPPPFADVNLFDSDRPLVEAVAREGAAAAEAPALSAFGEQAGSAEAFARGRLANETPPELRRASENGASWDWVEFHPAYHQAMAESLGAGLHSLPWEVAEGGGAVPAAQVRRLARLYMATQAEAGHICPVTMTHASVAALRHQPDLARQLVPKLTSRIYDPGLRPIAQKAGATAGMGMTERQGGTDVRANTTAAEKTADGSYRLTGHKWFLSAPMSDGFLMLAQAADGLSCFWVPRVLEDGTVNPLRLERLKPKLGNRSNASSEVELTGTHGWLVGEEGRGIQTILDMVTMTRLDCAVASAGQMRLALAMAIHHCRQRTVFQRHLVDQPVMTGVLADMALDVEAATALAFRLAGAFDQAAENPEEASWQRLMTPVTKYWVCKTAPALGYEAMECLGGNGYVEDGFAARLYRELPLNAIWEGSGNVMCLDVLRVMQREPDAVETVLAKLRHMAGNDPALIAALRRIEELLADPGLLEHRARHLIGLLALTAAAALLRSHAPEPVADAFIAARLEGETARLYGSAPTAEARQIVDRAFPPA